jgi:hypothetical protein
VVLLYVLVAGKAPTWAGVLTVAGFFTVTVAVLVVLGMLLARRIRSNAEVHLIAALAVGCIAVVSGLVPVAARIQGAVEALAPWNPISRFATALVNVAQAEAGSTQGGVLGIVLLLVFATTVVLRTANRPAGRAAERQSGHVA